VAQHKIDAKKEGVAKTENRKEIDVFLKLIIKGAQGLL